MSKAEQLAGFPDRIVQTLEDMADREPKGNRGPWQYSDGDQMQDDAEAFLKSLRRLSAINAELLEALEGFVEHGTCFDEIDMSKARAAIAKAQGEQP